MLLFCALEHFPSFPPLCRPQWHFLSEDECVQRLPPSLSVSISLSFQVAACISLSVTLSVSANYWLASGASPQASPSIGSLYHCFKSLFPSRSLCLSILLCHSLSFFFSSLILSFPLPHFMFTFFLSVDLSSSSSLSVPFLRPWIRPSPPQHPSFSLLSTASLSPSLPSPTPSFCKLLQLNCPFPACRQRWY